CQIGWRKRVHEKHPRDEAGDRQQDYVKRADQRGCTHQHGLPVLNRREEVGHRRYRRNGERRHKRNAERKLPISPRPARLLHREYAESEIRQGQRPNGSRDPDTPDYLKLKANDFQDYRLTVTGQVERPRSYSLTELRNMPSRTAIGPTSRRSEAEARRAVHPVPLLPQA